MNNNFVEFVSDLLSTKQGCTLVNKHFAANLNLNHNVSVTEVIAVLKLICAGAAVACPIIDSLPSS